MGLDALAEALADLFIARARAEVARELGVAEEDIDREHGRADADLRNLASMGMALDSTCDDCVTTQADTLKASRRPRRAAGRKG